MHIAIPERLSVVCVVVAMLAIAPDAQALDFRKYPALRTFAGDMAEKHGFSVTKLKRVFRCATIRPDIIEAMERPRELLPWHEYRKIFVTEDSAKRGARFWQEHAEDISRAQERYGVLPEIIVAIIGVETRYGRNPGNHSILDALTTLTLEYPSRAAFFREELAEFLLLTRELDINPCDLKGSYAGAMGPAQFLPVSVLKWGRDGNGDAVVNPFEFDDALLSAANFLIEHGWREDKMQALQRYYGSGQDYPRAIMAYAEALGMPAH